MKCLACDCILTDFEATRKYTNGTFIDLCNKCFYTGVEEDVTPLDREDLECQEDYNDL